MFPFKHEIRHINNSSVHLDLRLEEIFRVVPAMPEEMRPGPDPRGAPWELVICAVIGVFTLLLFLWRSVQSVRSRLYLKREKKLALKFSELIEEKCKLLDKVSLLEKEYKGLEASLKDANSEKESKEAQILETTNEILNRCKSNVGDKILFLEKEVKEEKSKCSEQEELLAETSQRIKSLEDESEFLKSQIAEAKTTLRMFQMKEEGLQAAIEEASNENSQLQTRQKHLLEEAEAWKGKVSDLIKQKTTFEECKVHVEQVLSDKVKQIKSLTERVLKMREWAPVLREDLTGDGNLELEVKTEPEIGAHLDDQGKRALKELVYAAKLNASLETLEGERDQISTLVSDVEETNEDRRQHIKNIQAEITSLKSENAQSENENQQLQQKFKVMIDEYHENQLKLHRKLRAEEKCRLEEERRLSEVEKKISHGAEQLETWKKQAKGLEEELGRTHRLYQRQIMFYEKKAHDNASAAWAADRNLKCLWQVNSYNRQRLAELEFQFQLSEQDLYALGVSKAAFGRERAPHQAGSRGFVFSPLAPTRGPLLPVDAGRQFMGRGPFLPPPPPRYTY